MEENLLFELLLYDTIVGMELEIDWIYQTLEKENPSIDDINSHLEEIEEYKNDIIKMFKPMLDEYVKASGADKLNLEV